MKIRRLHEIDLARISTQNIEAQSKQLKRLKSGYAPFSYNPFRKTFLDIVNAVPPLFPEECVGQSLEEIENSIRQYSKKGDVEFEENQLLAEVLFNEFRAPNIRCFSQKFFPVILRLGHSVAYWVNAVFVIDGVPHIAFFDQRRSRGLNADGRKFVFSMMHHHIREQSSDLTSAKLMICQFPDISTKDEKARYIKTHKHKTGDLFSFEELNSMIGTTYDLWTEILADREADIRRDTGDLGPLFGFGAA